MNRYICSECKETCVGTKVDFGIGYYEYWGAKCVDTKIQFVSQCCEAQMRDDAGDVIQWEDSAESYDDDAADDGPYGRII